MYKIKCFLWIVGYLFTVYAASAQNIEGELKKWHKVTLSFEGPQTSETATKNPFTDYRLDVIFSNGNKQYKVPGYFAADGNAANTSATSGNVWRVHFTPDETGTWTYEVSFKTGNDVAINGGGASAGFMDGKIGSFNIAPSDKSGRDHRAKGRLKYVGEHYLQFSETGEWFVKAGADAPENKLSYVDFDDTPKAKKDWAPHLQDYVASDAEAYTWKNGKGKGLLGAVAYLSNKGVNAFSFLTFSLDGDDKTVFPHLGKVNEVRNWNDVYHDRFDVSKMDQWEKIFEYADKKGMYLHFKTQETENDQKMDGGDVGRERKIYYRELIARYAHHLALNWNLGEENSQTTQQERDMAQYFYENDPYAHNIVMHTYPGQKNKYQSLLGNQSKLTGASLQTSNRQFSEVFDHVDEWVRKSAAAGKKWVVAVDEPGNASIGTHVDPNDRKLIRHKVVWATLMAGGTGVEFYYGYQSGCSDLTCEDHRTRDQKYTDAAYALKFFQQYFQKYLPDVVSDNQVTSDGSDYVLRSTANNAYVVYLPNGGSTGITLPNSKWDLQWYNPRNGQLQNASAFTGKTLRAPGNDDWVALLTSDGSVTPEPEPSPDPTDCNTVIKLDATTDFPNINVAGFVPAYKDNSRDALAVDAAQYKDQYAAAQTTFQGPSGTYDIRLNTLMERDGESSYRLYVGGKLMGTYTNPASATDYVPAGETWSDIAVQNGDLLQIEFNTATNQQVQEGNGFGYSRGRWQSLVFTCTEEDTTSQPDPIPEPDPKPDPTPTDERIFEEVDGYVAVEAEHFISQEKTDERQWYITGINQDPNVKPDPDGNHAQNASGEKYLEILPDTRVTHSDPLVNGVSFSNKPGALGILSYKIYFNNPGKYYVWVRAHSTGTEDNGIHVGLNGNWPGTGERMQWCSGKNQWTWESKQRTHANHCGEPRKIYLDIPSKGIHTINFSMREDGFEFDKFYLTQAYEKPTGNGPDERLYQDNTPKPDPCADNNAPQINILNPQHNAEFNTGEDVTINIQAEDSDGNIEKVSFYLNGKISGEDNTAPYEMKINNIQEGNYEIFALAKDNCKAEIKSTTISFKVTASTPDPDPDPTPDPDTTVSTVTLTPVHDAYLQYGRHYNTHELRAEINKRTTYLMFDLGEISGKIADASLQMTVGSDPGYGTIEISEGSHHDWTETNITDQNKPEQVRTISSTNQTYNQGEMYEWGLGEISHEGKLTLLVSHVSGNDVAFMSKEHNDKAGVPKLVLTLRSTTDTTTEEPVDPPSTDPDPIPVSHVIPGLIQAEEYDEQDGIRTQGTLDDGGGENIGWIQDGDYTAYRVNAEESGTYTITFRVASATQGGNIMLYSGEKELTTAVVGNTGGWQAWQSLSVTADLNAGNQLIRMSFTGGNGYLLNVNWVRFEFGDKVPGPTPDPADPCKDNEAPSISIIKPIENAYTVGETIDFEAEAQDADGSIATVEFILNGKPVQVERVYPYTYTLTNAPVGRHEIIAVAKDDCGTETRTNTLVFEVNADQTSDPDPVPPVTECEEFAEKDGLVIIEAESLPVNAPWVKKQDNLASGGTYIQWTGGNSYGKANKGITHVSISITKTGVYRFLWRMRQPDGVRSDLSNDSWINFPDTKFMDKNGKAYNDFIKIFGNGKGDFAWRATADVNHQKSPVYVEFTQPGTYTFQLAGRSDLHQIDRIVLFHESIRQSDATDLSRAETRCNSQLRLVDANADFPEEEEHVNVLELYPNPANTELYIDGEELEYKEVRIFDMTGREVIREQYRFPLDITELSAGLYHVLIGDYQIKRFVKK